MTIFYKLYDKLYVNITNSCSCACVFCIRNNYESVGEAGNLWLEHEPDLNEIKEAFDNCDLDRMTEIVFCGYGEPMERADTVIKTCEYIKSKCSLPVRINTNGLVKLINPDFDISRLLIFNSVSVSLNADNEDEYLRLTRSRFGTGSYRAILDFAREAQKYTSVCFTVVDVLEKERIQRCREIAEEIGIPLRIRNYVTDNENYI